MPQKSLRESTKSRAVALVVDDEAGIRDFLKIALESAGYEVLSAADGEEALGISQRFLGAIHLLLTDIHMPRMNGIDLARFIAEQRPETRLFFMTGYSSASLPASLNGRLVRKPFALHELLRSLEEKAPVDGGAP